MLAHVPFVGDDAGVFGEGAGCIVIARIVGDDLAALLVQLDADGAADAARASGDEGHSRHESSLDWRFSGISRTARL